MGEHPTSDIQHPTPNKPAEREHRSLDVGCFQFVVLFLLFTLVSEGRAEVFGDIRVQPSGINGNTFHGYAETRVSVENLSPGKTHFVTLVYPGHTFAGGGNYIRRISRSVKIEPGSRTLVSLLQPPLRADGDSTIEVEVDGETLGNVQAPNANSHLSRSYSGGILPSVVLTSRGVDFEAVKRLLNTGAKIGFSAEMATGGPDSKGRFGTTPSAWMPDNTRHGVTNWLELEYPTATTIRSITIFHTIPRPFGGRIILIGTNDLESTPISMGALSSSSSSSDTFVISTSTEPVKKVRLDFGTTSPSDISIDAVQITGPSGSAFASSARASSDNSASASAMSPGTESIVNLRAEPNWSENWLAYTPYDAIFLSVSELKSFPPGVMSALWSYMQAGGNVFAFGTSSLPDAWRSAQTRPFVGGTRYQIGFGDCYHVPSDSFSSVSFNTGKVLRDAANNSARYWQSLPHNSTEANSLMPIVENLKIPVRGIVFIMLAFVLAIGPVNLIVLNRKKRRTWMLWTIPAISFATCLIVFVYSLLREGITPDTRIAGVTFLDQVNHRAATIGGTAFYCPLTPGGGLKFNYETEATPLLQSDYYYGGYGGRYSSGQSGTTREVDWTQTQHFSRGWVSARVPTYFHLRKSETRRERLQIENNGGQLEVVNGLGATIISLTLADASGRIYHAQSVSAGQKARLVATSGPPVSSKTGLQNLFTEVGYAGRFKTPVTLRDNFLSPGNYIAELDGNPFIENALGSAASAKRTRASSIVFGILDPSDTK